MKSPWLQNIVTRNSGHKEISYKIRVLGGWEDHSPRDGPQQLSVYSAKLSFSRKTNISIRLQHNLVFIITHRQILISWPAVWNLWFILWLKHSTELFLLFYLPKLRADGTRLDFFISQAKFPWVTKPTCLKKSRKQHVATKQNKLKSWLRQDQTYVYDLSPATVCI